MGMYTELNIGVELKKDTPDQIIKILDYMVKGEGEYTKTDHNMFNTSRWDWMLRSGGSYYFDGKPQLSWHKDEITGSYFLSVRTNIKNYSSELEEFLDFIVPYIDTVGYLGTYRYEENENPTLVYNMGGKIHMVAVKGMPTSEE